MSTEYIERGALLAEIGKHIETIGANAERLVARFPAADVEPVVRDKCDVCGDGIGLGGGMRIIKHQGSHYIECDSPDSWYNDSESDEIYFCPNCGRKLDLEEGK